MELTVIDWYSVGSTASANFGSCLLTHLLTHLLIYLAFTCTLMVVFLFRSLLILFKVPSWKVVSISLVFSGYHRRVGRSVTKRFLERRMKVMNYSSRQNFYWAG